MGRGGKNRKNKEQESNEKGLNLGEAGSVLSPLHGLLYTQSAVPCTGACGRNCQNFNVGYRIALVVSAHLQFLPQHTKTKVKWGKVSETTKGTPHMLHTYSRSGGAAAVRWQ